MADTVTRGLSGQTLKGYAYCAGEKEAARRKRQIDNGTKGFPVWEGRKLKSWKALDASAKRRSKVAAEAAEVPKTPVGSIGKRGRNAAAVLGALGATAAVLSVTPKPKRTRRNSMGGGGS